MLGFALRRLVLSGVFFLGLLCSVFFLLRTIPGGPFDQELALPPAVLANLNEKFHLGESIWTQFWRYLSGVVVGDFGPSYGSQGNRAVAEILSESLPISLLMGFSALVVGTASGIFFGAVAAFFRGTLIDVVVAWLSAAVISLPSYLFASGLVLIFSLRLGWLPSALLDDWRSCILPIVVLAARPMGLIARTARVAFLEALAQDYIRVAWAKGAGPWRVLLRHAMKNSLVPVVTLLGPIFASLMTGSFVVEVMFALPGLGRYFVSSILDRDYPLVLGVTLTYGILLIFGNWLVDMAYALIDPRIRVS